MANITTTGAYGNITGANVISANTLQVSNGIFWANGTAWSSTAGGSTYSNTNVAAYLATQTFYSNSNVAAYLVANPQGSTYSNTNVASYLSNGISSNIVTTSNVFIGAAASNLYYATPLNITVANTGNVASVLSLVNTGGQAGAGTAIDLYTYTGAGQPPEARIYSIDNGDYSANIQFATKTPVSYTHLTLPTNREV